MEQVKSELEASLRVQLADLVLPLTALMAQAALCSAFDLREGNSAEFSVWPDMAHCKLWMHGTRLYLTVWREVDDEPR